MPTRIVREGILTSEKVNELTERAELFYRRLMNVVDDYGRYFSHPSLLRAACYALRIESVNETDVKRMLNECITHGLIKLYSGKKYLFITNFKQQTRSPSKFPEPTQNELLSICESNDDQMCSESESESESSLAHLSGERDGDFEKLWTAYPRKIGKTAAKKAFNRIKGVPVEKMLSAIANQKQSEPWQKDNGQFIPHPTTWLNQGRWDDVTQIEITNGKGKIQFGNL